MHGKFLECDKQHFIIKKRYKALMTLKKRAVSQKICGSLKIP